MNHSKSTKFLKDNVVQDEVEVTIRAMTFVGYQRLVERLVALSESVDFTSFHSAGVEYTSLMICFLLHNMVSAKSLLTLRDVFGENNFPATVGYAIVRTMFETEVTTHYITQIPIKRTRQYIDYEAVLNKKEMNAYSKHRNSNKPGWSEPLDFAWQQYWSLKEQDINTRYESVRNSFEKIAKKGQILTNMNWSGKSIRQMAIEVDHEEAYDIFYAELSSFAHVDVRLANRFLRINSEGISWSLHAREFDIGNVFRHAATFLSCYLELFDSQFKVWGNENIQSCWNSD